MKIIKLAVISILLLQVNAVFAETTALKGVKLGFGFDRGFGMTGSLGKLNGFIGNDGVAVDYLFKKDTLKLEVEAPMFWYIGVGGYGDWDGDLGVRVPVGTELVFAKEFDAYAQIIPRLRVNHDAKFGIDFGIGVRYKF